MRANSFFESEPLQVKIEMIIENGEVDLLFESEVLCQGSVAEWKGQSAVDFYSAIFYQDCHTVCGEGEAYKEWRGNWVASDTKSPALLAQSWVSAVGEGRGYYSKQPVILSEEVELFDVSLEEVYCVKLKSQKPDWAGLCDVHPDSLFGRNSLIDAYESYQVWLFFGVNDWELKAAQILAGTESRWTKALMTFERSEEMPAVDLNALNIVEGYLFEEWSMNTEG